MPEPSPASRPRWFAPQFSLRALLVLVTLSAIGTAFWFRWPIEEDIDLLAHSTAASKASVARQLFIPTREVRTVRRVWKGDPIRHGWTRRYNSQNTLLSETMWQEGHKHGPSREWRPDGTYWSEGTYLNGEKDGVWKVSTRLEKFPSSVSVQNWQRGMPHGIWKILDSSGNVSRTFQCSDGAAKQINGKLVDDPLLAKRLAGEIDSRRIHEAVVEDTILDFVDMPLKDVVMYLQEAHNIPIRLEARSMQNRGIRIDHPITEQLYGVPLSMGLVAMLEPHGLVADYRFGVVVICPIADAKNWRDRTGVSEIKPPPGSALARQWEKDVTLDFVETPLPNVMAYLTSQTNVPLDVSARRPQDWMSITQNLKGLSLKNSLGILCEGSGLHVRQMGDTLVIEPMEKPEP